MVRLDQLKLAQPFHAAPGTLCLARVDGQRPPMFTCLMSNKPHGFSITDPDDYGFMVDILAINMGPWIAASAFDISVNHLSNISPRKGLIPRGTLCLSKEQWCIAVGIGPDTGYIGLDGSLLEEPNYDSLVGFTEWSLEIDSVSDEKSVVYSAGKTGPMIG